MKSQTYIFLVILSWMGLSQARNFNGRSGQQSWSSESSYDYDYTYGDPDYDYEGHADRQGGQEEITGKKDVPTRRERVPHVVVDNTLNYDYTYGDPQVDYEYDIIQRDGERPIVRETPKDDHDGEEDHDDDDHPSTTTTTTTTTTPRRGIDDIPEIVSSLIEWLVRNWQDVKYVREKWIETKDHVKTNWGRFKHSMKRMRNALQTVLVRFGTEAEEGLRYYIVRFEAKGQEISEQGLEAIDKLEGLLEEGNEVVASFFRLIGQKVEELRSHYIEHGIDIDLGSLFNRNMTLSNYLALGGQGEEMVEQNIPNFFEDEEILQKLKIMVDRGILEKQEVEALLTAASQQTQRATGKKQPSKVVLIN